MNGQILCPKIVHGLLAACTDIYLAEMTRRAIYRSSAVSPPFTLVSF